MPTARVLKGPRVTTKDVQITGNLYRSETGRFSAGNGPSSDAPPQLGKSPKKPKRARGRKGSAKPKQTPEQRAAATTAKRAQNAADVAKRMAESDTGLSPSGSAALLAFAGGTQPDAQIGAGLASMGLAERANDGSYRMTPTGRAAVSAMQAGDYQRAVDSISRGTDASSRRAQRLQERAARQQAAAERRQAVQARREAVAARRAAKKPGAPTTTTVRPSGDIASAMQRLSPAQPKKKKKRRSNRSAPAAAPEKTRTKQTAQDRAMFANMGGSGGGGGAGGSGGKPSGGQGGLWNKNDAGKRVPQAGVASGKRSPAATEGKPRASDPGKPAHGQTVGNPTKAYGADPTTSYTMRHELVDMGDIQASNTVGGGINPKYDPSLQPRDRSRASSQAQIAEVAQKMNPEVLTTDFHRIDAGSPIIDAHGNVLSGNGRTLALQRAAEMHPDKYADYKASIRAQAREAGIDPAAVDGMKNPVLVRRLEPGVDTAAFAREANSSGTLRMSPLEQAKVDAGGIGNSHMLKLNVHEGDDIDRSLRSKDNKPFIDDFLASVPPNERANLLTRNGDLNQMGLYRVKAAVYTRAFPGAHGERMAESMLESLDPDVKQIQNGISGGLPSLSRAQSLIRGGQRESNLDISEDLAKTVDVYARIKDNPALTAGTPANRLVAKYLGQTSMFGRELNDEQERLLVHIDSISRSPTKMRSFLQKYARIVENEPQPGQSSLFGDAGNLTRAQLFDALLAEDTTTKAAMKAKRPMRGDLPPLPPVRKRTDYSDIKATDLVMALFHDKIAPVGAMRAEFEQDAPAEKSFTVFKDHTGRDRWIARTTTAYRDRDGEIISEAALDADSQRMMASKQFGPLRWWHVGDPDPANVAQPWGVGLDIGDCDYSVVIGRTRVESGTFRDSGIARKVAQASDRLEMSPGFFHPPDQPDGAGVFAAIRTFERSVVPVRYGRASNLFTGFTVKEFRMELDEMERRFKAMYTELGLSPEQGLALGQQLVQTEKAAQQQGIAFKDSDYPDLEINGVTYKAFPPKAAAPAEPDPGATTAELKAPPIEEIADDLTVEAEAPEGDYIGDMGRAEFSALLAEAFAPLLKALDISGKMGAQVEELKTMLGGVQTKDQGVAAEVAALKARLAEIEGNQPATILPDELAAALKGAPAEAQEPDAPANPALNDPTRPFAGWGVQTFPELYKVNGQP